MNIGMFRTQIQTANEILNAVSLGEEFVQYPNEPENPAAFFRELTYFDAWRNCFRNQYYYFQMKDNSLIQFSAEYAPLKLSYSFYDCPIDAVSYSEFVLQELDISVNIVGDELKEEYEDYLTECDRKDVVTPIRYDYSPELYRAGIHPASHFHFGKSNIRISTKKILKPLSFVLFIIRQFYPDEWQIILSMENATNWCRNIRDNLDEIHNDYFDVLDQNELHLS